MNRIAEALKIRPGEGRMAVLLIGLMLFTSGGGALGGNATEALFFARFGVELLPYMYMVLGVFTLITSLTVTALLGRIRREALYVALPFVLAFVLIAERLVIELQFKGFFAVMWLGMNVIGSLQGLLTWGLAGASCDTRQAKRLFPLFSAGGILGAVLGGLVTQPLARWLHSENLLLIWAGTLFVSFLVGRALTGRAPAARPVPSRRRQTSLVAEMQRGYQFVRDSPIMRWASVSAILFSVCFFSLALPFSRAATAHFPNADALAGFLGLFQSLNTAVALLASLFLANRLFARFGIMPMLLVFPAIYFVGFGVLAVFAAFPVLVAVRFAQMTWIQGIAGTAWQALFNVVPSERRDQVRAFVDGVPGQAGTFIAGLLLVVGEQALQPQQLYFIGLIAAGAAAYVVWQASRAYGRALIDALRAGQPLMFFSEEEPFGGFRRDAAAVSAAVRGMAIPDPAVRRVSAEILGHLPVPEATDALVAALRDSDTQVRTAALRGLARSKAAPALLEVAALLHDPEADVRLQAVEALLALAGYPHGLVVHVRSLLQDPDPPVRAHAALALLRVGPDAEAEATLLTMASASDALARIHAIEALGECGDASCFDVVAAGLNDPRAAPNVRRAAALAMVRLDSARALTPLIQHLNDDDHSVRSGLAAALGRIGEPALRPVVTALGNPALENGALLALDGLPAHKLAAEIRSHARGAVATALYYHDLAAGLDPLAAEQAGYAAAASRLRLLIDSLRDKAQRSAVHALRAIALLAEREGIGVAIENLKSRDPNQRANALETLESLGDREIVRPLVRLWEQAGAAPRLAGDWLPQLLHDDYGWLRACAALVARDSRDPAVRAALAEMSQSDTDPIVREIAAVSLNGDSAMDTLPTLSLMERILFLRRVPLFADLPPADLKQVAAIAAERLYPSGEVLAREGEPGDEMYIVVSGEVMVVTQAPGVGEQEIARRKSGDYVGEMAIISREPRMASLVAAGELRTLCIDQKQFEGILRERPETSLSLMRVLCQRLREASGGPRLNPGPAS